MKSLNIVSILLIAASIFSIAIYFTIANRGIKSTNSFATSNPPQTTQTKYDRPLCERLLRFGQTSFDRGEFVEAKHFFQKAITVDPTFPPAWRKYNMALLALISAKVKTDPAFLPEYSSDTDNSDANRSGPADSPSKKSTHSTEDDDDDC